MLHHYQHGLLFHVHWNIYTNFKTNPSQTPPNQKVHKYTRIYINLLYICIRYIIKDEALNIHVWITVNDDRKGICMLVGKLINEQLKVLNKKEVWSSSIYTTTA